MITLVDILDCQEAFEDDVIQSDGVHVIEVQPWFSATAFEARCEVRANKGNIQYLMHRVPVTQSLLTTSSYRNLG